MAGEGACMAEEGACVAGKPPPPSSYGWQAGGTLPTGMLSC